MTHPGTAPRRRLIPYAGWEPPPRRRPKTEAPPPRPVPAGRRQGRVDRDRVRKLIDAGLSRSDVARQVGCDRAAITKIIGRIPDRRQYVERMPEIVAALRAGASNREVATRFGLSEATARKYRKEHDIPPLPRGQPGAHRKARGV